MQMRAIDNGFFIISRADAITLARSVPAALPRAGKQLLVKHDGKEWWLMQTKEEGRMEWAIYLTPGSR